ncbi:MAG: long-chain fatty acid--CoA ligase, partial [Spirochaetaceae bacterium]|nr:long-chain fatty acid--CoA ligase [Spirochaetaceae bacterium]
ADSDGERLPAGHDGELVASGPNITSGYWKDPEASAAVLRNGRYFTGDLGMEDEEGFLFVTGRSKDIIKVKGFRVSPREIEERLLELDGVSEAAVIGVSDDLLGEAPVAYVVSADDGGPTEDLLRRALQQRLASYKVPTGFVFLETLPQNASGKIDKQVLRENYSRRSQ